MTYKTTDVVESYNIYVHIYTQIIFLGQNIAMP